MLKSQTLNFILIVEPVVHNNTNYLRIVTDKTEEETMALINKHRVGDGKGGCSSSAAIIIGIIILITTCLI